MDLLNVSSSPHIRDNVSTQTIMRDVAIALLPACAFGVYNFGIHALLLIVVSTAACVLTEFIYQKLMKKTITISDFSAAVTGILIALNLPPTLPIWMAVLGSAFAIVIVKQLYGGVGQNIMNPALAARCFLLICFAGQMTTFTFDGQTGATPLALIKSGDMSSVSLSKMFIGTIAGTIGETSVIAILIGAAYLLYKRIISLRIPLTYILTFTVFIILFSGHGLDIEYIFMELCGGGLMLGAFFMATDYVTSPITPDGQIVFGILLGLLTGIFRIFGGSAEGVSYAIIFCNLLVPLIERFTIPVPFGRENKKEAN